MNRSVISRVVFALSVLLALTSSSFATATYDFSAFLSAFTALKTDWIEQALLLIPIAMAVWGLKIGVTALIGFGARLFRKG